MLISFPRPQHPNCEMATFFKKKSEKEVAHSKRFILSKVFLNYPSGGYEKGVREGFHFTKLWNVVTRDILSINQLCSYHV